jgi:hypothetical protein
MAKIININKNHDSESYKNVLENIFNFLNETQSALNGYALNLACEGVWKDWNKEQKEGSTFSFDFDAISELDDDNIRKLFELKSKIAEVNDDLLLRVRNASLHKEIPRGAFQSPEPEEYTKEEMYKMYLECKDTIKLPTIATMCNVDTKDLEDVIKEFVNSK